MKKPPVVYPPSDHPLHDGILWTLQHADECYAKARRYPWGSERRKAYRESGDRYRRLAAAKLERPLDYMCVRDRAALRGPTLTGQATAPFPWLPPPPPVSDR